MAENIIRTVQRKWSAKVNNKQEYTVDYKKKLFSIVTFENQFEAL